MTRHATRFVDPLRRAFQALGDDGAPHQIAVALDHRVRSPELVRLFRVERRVDSAEDNPRAGLAGLVPDFVASQRVTGVDADPDHVARTDVRRIEDVERLVADDRIPVLARRGCGQDVQPAGGDDRHSERQVARINQVNAHARILSAIEAD